MISTKTVFVLGAGFSYELGLPLGNALRTQIASTIRTFDSGNVQEFYYEAFFRGRDQRAVKQSFRALLDALPTALSIDNVIEHRSDNLELVETAKRAIVALILQAERKSSLWEDWRQGKKVNLEKAENSALFRIFQSIAAGHSVSQIVDAFANVAFVNFNYDRCLEHFLFNALRGYSGLSDEVAAEIINGVQIWHPYGVVGKLHWQKQPDPTVAPARFGDADIYTNVGALAQGIKTYSEEVSDRETIDAVRACLESAYRVVFLGFAFHSQNMKLLRPTAFNPSEVFATCYKVPPEDGLIKPDAAEFALPDIEAFKGDVIQWCQQHQKTPERYKFEALTSLQLVAKYENNWRRPPPPRFDINEYVESLGIEA